MKKSKVINAIVTDSMSYAEAMKIATQQIKDARTALNGYMEDMSMPEKRDLLKNGMRNVAHIEATFGRTTETVALSKKYAGTMSKWNGLGKFYSGLIKSYSENITKATGAWEGWEASVRYNMEQKELATRKLAEWTAAR